MFEPALCASNKRKRQNEKCFLAHSFRAPRFLFILPLMEFLFNFCNSLLTRLAMQPFCLPQPLKLFQLLPNSLAGMIRHDEPFAGDFPPQ
jgi:hypothetical protein